MSKPMNTENWDHQDLEMGVECALTPAEVVEKYLFPDNKTRAASVDPVTVSVRLYPGTLSELDRVAKTLGVSRSRLMAEFLEGALAEALQYMSEGPHSGQLLGSAREEREAEWGKGEAE